jgi:hypothetical protein
MSARGPESGHRGRQWERKFEAATNAVGDVRDAMIATLPTTKVGAKAIIEAHFAADLGEDADRALLEMLAEAST